MKHLLAAGTVLALSGCAAQSELRSHVQQHCDGLPDCVAKLVVSNPSEFARSDEALRFSYDELGVTKGPLAAQSADRSSLASQEFDTDTDGVADSVLFLVDLPARGAETVFIVRGETSAVEPRAYAEVSVKSGGSWQGQKYVGGTFVNVDQVDLPPQYTDHSEYLRYEGPGIETESVGYRVYLDWRNGFDIFGKRRSGLVLAAVGLDGYASYHEMADWGADVLKVGDAVGIGGYGAWRNDQIVRVSDVKRRSVAVPVTGPLFAKFVIDYDDWNTGSSVTDLTAGLSMTAGSRFVNVDLTMSNPLKEVAVGIVRHPNTKLLRGDTDVPFRTWTYVASWGNQSLFGDGLGMAVLFRRTNLIEQTQDEHNYVTLLGPRDDSLEYAFAASWAGEENGASTAEEFRLALEREIERRNLEPRVRLSTAKSSQLSDAPLTAQLAMEVSRRLANSERARTADTLAFSSERSSRRGGPNWTYTTGLLMQAIDDVGAAVGDRTLQDYASEVIASFVDEEGNIRTYEPEEYNIDMINSGLMLFRVFDRRGEARFESAADLLTSQLESHPRTSEGAFWHKQIYPHQLWLDGLYMGMPFLAAVGQRRDDEKALADAVKEFQITRRRLRDPATGLYFHAWDEARAQSWADPKTGLSSQIWGRALGWYAMAVVDTLDYIPAHRTDLRAPLLDIINELAPALVKYQSQTGVWYQIMDRPEGLGNYQEASASAMFVYFLAKAINKGYLPDSYRAAALHGYEGMLDEFVTVDADDEINLRSNCEVAGLGYGRDGSYRYYMSEPIVTNDPKGVGPMMMAGLQIAEVLRRK
jgi:unsaturated rhamnogalacturonyl hydrolase